MADLSRERHLMISQIAYASSPDVRFEEVKAILVEYDRRVTELLAANTAEVERRRAAEALAERMWPIIQEVAEADILGSDWPPQMRCGIPITIVLISAAGALVREREEKETRP